MQIGETLVEPFTEARLTEVVRVCLAASTWTFTFGIGPTYLREYFRTFVGYSGGCGFVCTGSDGKILGYVVGTESLGAFYRSLARRLPRMLPALAAAPFRRGMLWGILRRAPRLLSLLRERPASGNSRSHEGTLMNIAVLPEGRRTGIAASLMTAFEAEMQRRGLRRLNLMVRESNHPARRLYETFGWQSEESVSDYAGTTLLYTKDFTRASRPSRVAHQDAGRILVMVVNYYCEPEVRAFVRGVLCQRFEGALHITVVDNSPGPDGNPALDDLPDGGQVEVVRAPSNLGYFGGARLALDRWLESNPMPDWIVLSNPDVVFANARFFDCLARLYRDDPPALVVPSILNRNSDSGRFLMRRPSPRRMRFYKRVFSRPTTSVAYHLISSAWRMLIRAFNRLAPPLAKRRQSSHRRVPIYAPHGSFMIFNRLYFERGGTLNHGAFMFGEEVFVAETARRLDLEITLDPRLVVLHRGKTTTRILRNPQVLGYMRDASAYLADELFASGS